MRGTLDNETTMKRIVLKGLRIFWLCLLAYAGMQVLARMIWFPRVTHSLRKYPSLRAKWDQELIAHFPQTIPKYASLKKFSHYRMPGRGLAHIQLRLVLPPNEIEKLCARFAKERTKSFFGGDWSSHQSEKDGMYTTYFNTGEADQRSFPDDYEIMVLDKAMSEEDRLALDHGHSHGVAISKRRNEVIYWAKVWRYTCPTSACSGRTAAARNVRCVKCGRGS